MAEVIIRESVWRNFVAVAQRRKQPPEALAQQVLQDYIRRVTDEELLTRSSRSARRARFRISEAEEVVRRYRRTR